MFLSKERTMSSIEISELVESRHDSVKRTIERLIKSGAISEPPLVDGVKFANGTVQKHYSISKRDSYVIVAQLSPQFTAALVDRWQELEKGQKLKLPQSFSEALQLAANQAKQLEDQAPKIEVYNRLADRKNDVSTTTLSKQLGISATKLNKWMRVNGIKFASKDMPISKYAEWFNVVSDVSEHNGHEFTQCLITPKGQIENSEEVFIINKYRGKIKALANE